MTKSEIAMHLRNLADAIDANTKVPEINRSETATIAADIPAGTQAVAAKILVDPETLPVEPTALEMIALREELKDVLFSFSDAMGEPDGLNTVYEVMAHFNVTGKLSAFPNDKVVEAIAYSKAVLEKYKDELGA